MLDKILSYIKINGPVVPAQLTKAVKKDTIMIGAFLSELAKQKKLLISHAKIGGSPVYYLPEQKHRLIMLIRHLNEKDRRACQLLQQKKVLRDSELSPLLRVSMRSIRDFAKPLKVIFGQKQELFWAWYLLPKEQATKAIKEMLQKKAGLEKESQEQNVKAKMPDARNLENKSKAQKPLDKSSTETRKKESFASEAESENKSKKKSKAEIAVEIQKKQENLAEKEKTKSSCNSNESSLQQQLTDQKLASDAFFAKIKNFFKEKGIVIRNAKQLRKNTELELFVSVPSAVGFIDFYAKAKSKKRITDSDLASVYLNAQLEKMPAMLIITGTITKKAEGMLKTSFKGLKLVVLS